MHAGEDMGPGLLRRTEREREPSKGLVEEAVKTYRVASERDKSGWWVASVRDVHGCHTHGRTVDEARRGIVKALGLFVHNARKAVIGSSSVSLLWYSFVGVGPREDRLQHRKLPSARTLSRRAEIFVEESGITRFAGRLSLRLGRWRLVALRRQR